MKRCIFWLTFPLTMVLFIAFALIELAARFMERCMHMWEAWCFDYNRDHDYIGDGIWRERDAKDQGK